jgi:glycosyltransferase involved in cell wall biosynthesis
MMDGKHPQVGRAERAMAGRSEGRRIAVIAPPFFAIPPVGYGGTERVVSVLTEGLVAAGHDVTLFAAPGSVTSARLVTPLERPIPLGDPAGISEELLHAATAYLAADGFDVVHDHTGLGPAMGAMLSDQTPVVHTLHGPWTAPSGRLLQRLSQHVHLVAISQAQRASNPRVDYAGVVYNGVDLAAYPFNPHHEDYLVFVGRISPEKRPEVAIEIARQAGLPLVMIIKRSEPAEWAYWDDVVSPRLHRDVVVVDQPSHDVKVDLVARARAMLFPIDWPEPFGLVMTEAMACGTPVIARSVGSVPEVVVDGVTGFVCNTADEMVDAVSAATTLKPRDCRLHVERYFSAQAMVAGYELVYQRVTPLRLRSA